ncbi:DUF2017 domain-containing protein [Rhodococcus sp. G-MC3]|uniref:oxidative stress transcriptional regulator AosR n=1 Tax=Rhodococcus sp. G-MC3 TaxID=3046209 RepID=UPI0024B92787|nr:DUF2017 domain-containing protein [Rhodococcus sp. G-MC3]MDJ0396296.1 DUF2017 domain-containing protein [Rhodococcus sp. G-MC3]
MRTWSRKNSLGGVKIRSDMDAREASVLRSLVGSVVGLLNDRAAGAPEDELAAMTGLRTGHNTPPADAALARLLPEFHRQDPESGDADSSDLNGALRGLYEPEIIDDKLLASNVILNTLPASGGKIVLTTEQADAWLMGLNDVRLALGTTLGIDADTPEVLDEGDPRAPHLDVYHWLTWMQDSLVQVLTP